MQVRIDEADLVSDEDNMNESGQKIHKKIEGIAHAKSNSGEIVNFCNAAYVENHLNEILSMLCD
jgi:hypothetical protein